MIKYFQIENFKSLKKVSIPMERLNLFLGMDGMGKSSVIQALLLLRQSFWMNHQSNMDTLHINGELAALGTGKDVLCQSAVDEHIRFFLQCSENNRFDFLYRYEYGQLPNDSLKRMEGVLPEHFHEALFEKNFYYLGAEHIGPQKSYRTEMWKPEGVDRLGINGQYVVPYLAREGERFKVPEVLCSSKGKTNRLMDQVSAWMSEISPGIRINAQLLPQEEQAKLLVSYTGERLETENFLPVNVGFGIPYVLPLIVELLISTPNSLLLIENPESHLHPKGQAMMAQLIAKAAANGAQIICETHSDHVINGLRVAIKKGMLDHQEALMTYFDKNENQETQITNIDIDSKGNLSEYPKGLLDEWGILMSELI